MDDVKYKVDFHLGCKVEIEGGDENEEYEILFFDNKNNKLIHRGIIKSILRSILRRLPIIRKYIPITFNVGNAVSEYDAIIRDWIERHDGDEEMDVDVMLGRMCDRKLGGEEDEVDDSKHKDEL
jgi:hypothetical protein